MSKKKDSERPTAVQAREMTVRANAITANPTESAPDGCATCGQALRSRAERQDASAWTGMVYAVGRIVPEFPSLGVEKEFAQLAGGAWAGGEIDMEALHRVLRDPENRYLARNLCWVFTAQDIDAFTVQPRAEEDLARMVEIIEPTGSENTIHVIVGRSVPRRSESPCAQRGLPEVVADQFLAFTLDEFARALPGAPDLTPSSEDRGPGGSPSRDHDEREQLETVVRDLFLRLTRRIDNHGMTDDHRALNYVAVRYPQIYHAAAEARRNGKALIGVDVAHSHSPSRRVAWVRLAFRHHRTDITERYQCLVDVTEVFPFLATRLQPTYD